VLDGVLRRLSFIHDGDSWPSFTDALAEQAAPGLLGAHPANVPTPNQPEQIFKSQRSHDEQVIVVEEAHTDTDGGLRPRRCGILDRDERIHRESESLLVPKVHADF
jgi:hypothetical protein